MNRCSAGSEFGETVDPGGNVYTLKEFKDSVSMDDLETLGDQMTQLPEGWAYRSRVLTDDLAIALTPDAPNPSVSDEFDQVYVMIPE